MAAGTPKPGPAAAAAAAQKPETAAASAQKPTLGRVVHYRLSKQDAAEINRRRKRFSDAPEQSWGFQAHYGSRASAGDVCTATVVRIFEGNTVNLQVLLDGSDTFWATWRKPGDEDGQWFWPPRS